MIQGPVKPRPCGCACTYLLSIETFGRVEGLNERRGVTHEERVARGSRQHADHREPDVGDALGRVLAVPDA